MHNFTISLIRRLNQNKFFKFISSIQLAVPVMLGIIISVAAGTIFESLHNAEYAKMAVYGTTWFYCLLSLLWLNIFSSMMSRYPWKKHHLGFVLTHIGIMTLLAGSFITSYYGIDGSLQIPEGQKNNTVMMPRLMVGYQFENSPTVNSVVFEKTLFEKDHSDLGFINDQIGHIVQVEKFVPFAAVEKGYSGGSDNAGPIGVSFGLKSQFFDVKEWLHSVDNPQMQMGPATLRLIIDDGEVVQVDSPSKRRPSKVEEQEAVVSNSKQSGSFYLKLLDAKSKSEVSRIDLKKQPNGTTYKGVHFKVVKSFQRAIVASNKIVENEDPASPLNPAVELSIEKGGKNVREVIYAKYSGFSLNKEGVYGYLMELVADGTTAAQGMEGHSATTESAPHESAGSGNIVEFHVNRKATDQVKIILLKAGKKVAEKIMKEGETFQTPWMGMQLFLASISFGSEAVTDVRAVKPVAGGQMPPSAVLIKPAGMEKGFWLTQGDVKSAQVSGKNISFAFTNETYSLPFSLSLEKFTKKDYPGTETPYSYESLVKLETDQSVHLISMNEPLKVEGFTLYQASYIMNPGQPPVTVLSVNRDPGRPIKYLGSLILAFGFIIFTLMRSRFYTGRIQKKSEE
jgi:hypothetical protein